MDILDFRAECEVRNPKNYGVIIRPMELSKQLPRDTAEQCGSVSTPGIYSRTLPFKLYESDSAGFH
jgi:hypothetical protein